MKSFLLFCFIISAQLLQAQNPLLVKSVSDDILRPSSPDRVFQFQQWNGKQFYNCNGGLGLCVTDGTTAGTTNIYTFTLPAAAKTGAYRMLGPANDFMYILLSATFATVTPYTNTPEQQQIWKSDGTTAGTQLVYTINSTIGTRPIFSNRNSDANRPALGIMGNMMMFSQNTTAEGQELWKTDGTNAGTTLVKDINPGTNGSAPYNFGSIGNKVLFYATDGVVGAELWSTDGTEAGTQLVKDINADNSAGGSAYISGSNIGQNNYGVLKNKYFFQAYDPATSGTEPWVSDGTTAGTFLLKDINPGTASSYNNIGQSLNEFFATDDYMFFRAKDLTRPNDAALWRSDGTPDGTIFLSRADSLSSTPGVASASGKKYMLILNAGTGQQKILMSDGTLAGTKVVDSVWSNISQSIIYKGAGYFLAMRRFPPTIWFDNEMHRTDGTRANSGMLFDLFPGRPSSFVNYNAGAPQGFFTLNNYLYFFGTGSAGSKELYRYDGDFTFNGSVAGRNWQDSANWNSMAPPGITDSVYINTAATPTINAGIAYAGTLIMQDNAQINLANSTDSLFVNSSVEAAGAGSFTGDGILVIKNNEAKSVAFNNGFTANNLVVQSEANLVNGNINVSGSLQLGAGNLLLNNNNVTLTGNTSLATGNEQGYVVTNGTGKLAIENIGSGGRTGNVEFPVGTTTDYNPITFSNTGVSDVFSARVKKELNNAYTGDNASGASYTQDAVNATWFISEGTPGGSIADIALQWNQSQELSGFDRTQSRLGHYLSNNWANGCSRCSNRH